MTAYSNRKRFCALLATSFLTLSATQALAAIPTTDGFALNEDGAHFITLDGNVKVRGGFISQFEQRNYLGNSITTTGDEFRTRRLRPYMEMKLYDIVSYRIVADYAGPTDRIIDNAIDITPNSAFNIRLGKFKAPLSVEQLQGDETVFFTERGLPSNLMSTRDVGAMAYGNLLNNQLEYQLALLSGNMDGSQFDANADNKLDIVGRVFANPLEQSGNSWLAPIGVGIAASHGKHEGSLSRPLAPRYRSIGQQSVFSYSSGTFADGDGWRLIPQANYFRESFGLSAEYAISSQEYTRGAAHRTLSHHAWQLTTNYVLTGEKATIRNLEPARPFDIKQNQWGAFELVARTGRMSFDDGAFPAFASLATSVSDITDYGIGLNWYLNNNLRFSLDYDINHFTRGTATGDRPDEQYLVLRTQLKF